MVKSREAQFTGSSKAEGSPLPGRLRRTGANPVKLGQTDAGAIRRANLCKHLKMNYLQHSPQSNRCNWPPTVESLISLMSPMCPMRPKHPTKSYPVALSRTKLNHFDTILFHAKPAQIAPAGLRQPGANFSCLAWHVFPLFEP